MNTINERMKKIGEDCLALLEKLGVSPEKSNNPAQLMGIVMKILGEKEAVSKTVDELLDRIKAIREDIKVRLAITNDEELSQYLQDLDKWDEYLGRFDKMFKQLGL